MKDSLMIFNDLWWSSLQAGAAVIGVYTCLCQTSSPYCTARSHQYLHRPAGRDPLCFHPAKAWDPFPPVPNAGAGWVGWIATLCCSICLHIGSFLAVIALISWEAGEKSVSVGTIFSTTKWSEKGNSHVFTRALQMSPERWGPSSSAVPYSLC